MFSLLLDSPHSAWRLLVCKPFLRVVGASDLSGGSLPSQHISPAFPIPC